MFLLAKYNTQTTFYFPMVTRGSVDLAGSGTWTPATGDTKISKDGGSFANTTNNPSAVSGTGSVGWSLTLTATELSAAVVSVQIVDSATKAVEDQFITIYTFGNASAKIIPDWSDSVRMGLTSLPNAAAEASGGLYTRGTGAGQINQTVNGLVNSNVIDWTGTAVATPDTNGYPKVTIKSGTGTGELSLSAGLIRLSAAGVDDIWDEVASGHTTSGTFGKYLDTQISTLSIPTAAAIADAVWEEALSDHSGTSGSTAEALNAAGSAGDPWNTALPGAYTSGKAGYILGTFLTAAPPTASAIADQVWEEALSDHSGTSGSTAEALAAAGTAGDPWGTSLPGSYTSGQAGYIIGTYLTAAPPSASAIADAVFDEAYESTYTLREYLRLSSSVEFGILSGADGTTVSIRDLSDSKDRVTATVDADGNRSAVTLDAS